MKVIAKLTDKEILGLDGESCKAPRYTARAIVRDSEGLYAVMYAEKFHLYSLPGGGIEEGEDVITALRREIREETGCSCMEIRELGIVEENRGTLDYTQINYYFLVLAQKEGECCLTEAEKESAAAVQWHPLKNVIDLITNQKFERVQGKYLCARDVAVLKYCEEMCQL